MLHLLVTLTFIARSTSQVVVQRLNSNGFGHTKDAAVDSDHASSRSPDVLTTVNRIVPEKDKVHWKQAAARAAASLKVTNGTVSEWEQHKNQKAIEKQIEDLKHAQGAIGYLEERAVNKLGADIDEVDHLIVRRHLLTDKQKENEKDISTIESHASALAQVAVKLKPGISGKESEEAQAVNEEIKGLREASAALRGAPGEVEELSREIDAITADGRKMDSQVRRFSRNRAAVSRQIRVLTQEGDELQDGEETARDFEAFEKAGYDDMSDKDDPYLKEASDALERASGWKKNDLDEKAVKAREVMTKGLSANPGEAVRALRSVRPYTRFLF